MYERSIANLVCEFVPQVLTPSLQVIINLNCRRAGLLTMAVICAAYIFMRLLQNLGLNQQNKTNSASPIHIRV